MNKKIKIKLDIPEKISDPVKKLQENGFEAFLVGGCVRDLLLNNQPNDWDITTNATPKEIQKIFKHTFYKNNFGTVSVVNDALSEKIEEKEKEIGKIEKREEITKKNTLNNCETNVIQNFVKQKDKLKVEIIDLEKIKIIEITPYRTESIYSNNRHPDKVSFSKKLEDDLKRRDFTINALSYNPITETLIDLFGGIQDLQKKEIKTIGNSNERFKEDALRMLRAIRFSSQLEFKVNHETSKSIIKNSTLLKNISKERVRDEFIKILLTNNPIDAFFLAKDLKILKYISKDLERGIGIEQNGAHLYDVFEHLLRTMQHSADRKWSLNIRLASLFHDISKPETRKWNKNKKNWTFYNHEVVGARVTQKNLEELKFDSKTINKITLLVRWHMFFSDPEKITLSAVRRIIRNVGEENVWDLIKLRISDRIGMGRPKEKPYRLRQYLAMMDEVMRSPISVKDLKINGDILISKLNMKPGKKIGLILNALMGITLYEPEKNNYQFLIKQTKKYTKLSDKELINLSKKGIEKICEEEKKELKKIHKKHKIK